MSEAIFALQAGSALKAGAVQRPAPTSDDAAATKAAQDFEAVFLNEFLGAMFAGIKSDGPFGGGPGEQIFRSLLLDQYSRALAGQGGFGLADAVKREILAMQEVAQ